MKGDEHLRQGKQTRKKAAYTSTTKEPRRYISAAAANTAKAILVRIFSTLILKMKYLLTQDFPSDGVRNASSGAKN